jgi:hypothetical protein
MKQTKVHKYRPLKREPNISCAIYYACSLRRRALNSASLKTNHPFSSLECCGFFSTFHFVSSLHHIAPENCVVYIFCKMLFTLYYFLLLTCLFNAVQTFVFPIPVLSGDVVAGVVAAAGVAPFVSAVDRAITLNAAGKKELWTALQENLQETAKAPVATVKSVPFLWLWFVYAVTYVAANTTDTLSVTNHVNPAIPVLIASTAFNTVACVAKDASFAKMYGAENKKPLPTESYVLWLGRDIITAFSVFTLPPLLSTYNVPSLLSRLAGPVVAQYFTTPLHLAGLALYNLPAGSDYVATVQAQLPSTVLARQLRILPAFSLGGIVNSQLRDMAHDILTHTTSAL